MLRCGREKRPPKDRQINGEISSMVEQYDMNWKLSFTRGCPDIPRATHSIYSPGGHGMKTRAGHRGDSASSPNACGKEPMVGNARFSALCHDFASQYITLNWLETHNTVYLLDRGLWIQVHGKLQSATWVSELIQWSHLAPDICFLHRTSRVARCETHSSPSNCRHRYGSILSYHWTR